MLAAVKAWPNKRQRTPHPTAYPTERRAESFGRRSKPKTPIVEFAHSARQKLTDGCTAIFAPSPRENQGPKHIIYSLYSCPRGLSAHDTRACEEIQPRCSQLDAVLAAVKAWPGDTSHEEPPERRPALTASRVPIPIVRKHLPHTLGERSESKGHEQLYGSSAPLNPKFANGLAARVCELRVRGTRARRHWQQQVGTKKRP